MTDTGALLRFVQRSNSVDLATGKSALEAAGRYSELVALLTQRNRRDLALELLQQLSQQPQDLPVSPQGASLCGPPHGLSVLDGVLCKPGSCKGVLGKAGPQVSVTIICYQAIPIC